MSNKYGGGEKIIEPCTCGRKPRDKSDWVCLFEYRYKYYGNKGKMAKKSTYSVIACTRKGCLGRKRARYKFLDFLQIVPYDIWMKSKENSNV